MNLSLQFRADYVLLRGVIPADSQDIRLAANLAIFHVALARTGGRIHLGLIPFTATSALETGKHDLQFIVKQKQRPAFKLTADFSYLPSLCPPDWRQS